MDRGPAKERPKMIAEIRQRSQIHGAVLDFGPSLDCFVRRIDPSFDMTRELAPLARELMRERISPARLRGGAGKLFAALGRAALSTPSLVGQIEKVARTGSITVSIAPKDLERLRANERGSRSNPQLYPAAIGISAAILFSSEPIMAGLLAFVSVALAVMERVRRQ